MKANQIAAAAVCLATCALAPLSNASAADVQAFGPCVPSVTGATSASNSGTCPGQFGGPPGVGSSSGDLATGILRATAAGFGFHDANSNLNFFNGSAAGIQFNDEITITGNIAAPVTIGLTMTEHGSISGAPTAGTQQALMVLVAGGAGSLGFNRTQISLTGYGGDPAGLVPVSASAQGTGTWTLDSLVASNFEVTLTELIHMDAFSPHSFGIGGELEVQPQGSGLGELLMDFGNTAHLSLTLPEGLGFTSASGVFLSAVDPDTNPIPEPGSLLLIGPAFIALLLQLQKHRSDSGPAAVPCV